MSEKIKKVVVIGGGVVGCSVLYHLTKLGWKDVLLIERSELTSGSTWHAAGGFHTINADTNITSLQEYTINLYKELEALTGVNCGLHHVGGITIATSKDRLDFLRTERAKHKHMGLNTHLLTPNEIKKISPIINTNGVLGGLYDPLDGHLDPSGTTHAYAKAAKMNGAEIMLRNRVLALEADKKNGGWVVKTEQGNILTEHVVNAAGLWAREVGAMAGVYLPLHPMEHQYFATENIDEVVQYGKELPHVMDPGGESYLRQEGLGLVIGFYEQSCVPWAVKGTPWDFGHELLANDLDRIGDSLELAYERYPVLEKAGIKKIINGPFTFAPDGNPLVGPVSGLKNFWSACGVMAGFSQGGGVGLSLAEWMINGEPSRDVFAMDVSRFGDYCTPEYTKTKVVENYQRRFSISYPNEELPAARPYHTTPMYQVWDRENAVFGSGYGMEHVNYFAKNEDPRYETPTFRRSNAFNTVKEECLAVREGVGINEIHNFSKFLINGPKASKWLDFLLAGHLPAIGKLSLTPMLSSQGRLFGDFTVSRFSENEFQLTASYSAQAFHQRWFEFNLPKQGVSIRNVSRKRLGFQIAGPQSRLLLDSVADIDCSNKSFPFLGVRSCMVGDCQALVQRVSYTGDLGYEIYVDELEQVKLYNILKEAGGRSGLRPFGMRAMMSLRLEKSFGSWLREFKPDYYPEETGLSRFVAYKKKVDFIGKENALKELEKKNKRRICTFIVDAEEADVFADEPIWHNGELCGFVTSGGYAHYVGKSVALGFIPVELMQDKKQFEIEILGDKRKATMMVEPLFDPQSLIMRG